MPPTDASADVVPGPGLAFVHPGRADARESTGTSMGTGDATVLGDGEDSERTLNLRLPEEFVALLDGRAVRDTAEVDDLLDRVHTWGPTATPVGRFQVEQVRVDRDLPLIHRWMSDPGVAAFWELDGPQSTTERHVRAQLDGDGRSVPCLGLLNGIPMSYWEIYRADLDPLARHYPARPHDTGIHLLVGGSADRGRGLGSTLIRAVADMILDRRSACARVVAEPDLRNTPSVAAFLNAGFRFAAETDLPGKRAALMIRDRYLRDAL
ncbi:GNAT family N-acetyltransferase [Streptomyces sp. NPDC048297]|uniref:GNAT family N-acetyltransferase n=1 Tax=Streptomyces sp. NPDC048297 TaxID=3365531 RepID=UPI00371CF0B4